MKEKITYFEVLVKAWIEKDGKFLLAKRGMSEKHEPGAWSLPGGKIDDEIRDEIIQHTLKKEIKEEVNIEIYDDIKLIYNNSFTKSDGSKVINLTFLCKYKFDDTKPCEDTSEIMWLSLEELINLENKKDYLEREISFLNKYLSILN